MVTENISIDVRPGGVPVVIHVTQYEVGLRKFVFTPYTSNGTQTVVAGSATLEGTKPDGYAFQQACQMIDGVITYTLQEQLCAVEGRVWSRLVVRDADGGMIGYTAIVWVVGRAGVADDAVMSDSDISALQQFLDQFGEIDAYRGALDQAVEATMEQANLITVLTARMDSFARLPDGSLSTAADAELADVRVMAGGQTAPTAGDAVRLQVAGLNGKIGWISEPTTNLFDPYTIDIGKNANGDSGYPKRALSGVMFSDTGTITIKPISLPANLKYIVSVYSGESVGTRVLNYPGSGWFENTDTVKTRTAQTTNKYFRILFASVDDNNLQPSDFAGLKMQVNAGDDLLEYSDPLTARDEVARGNAAAIAEDVSGIEQSVDTVEQNITGINQSITGINQSISTINDEITEISGDVSGITGGTTNLFNPNGITIGLNAAGNSGFPQRAMSDDMYSPTKTITVKAIDLPANLEYQIQVYETAEYSSRVYGYPGGWTTTEGVVTHTVEVNRPYHHFRILFGSINGANLTKADFDGLVMQVNAGDSLLVYDGYETAVDSVVRGQPTRLRVMEYNIGHYCYGAGTSFDETGLPADQYDEKVANMKAFFAEYQPDVLCMCEFWEWLDNAKTHKSDDVLFDPIFPYKFETTRWNAMKSNYELIESVQGTLGGSGQNYLKSVIIVNGKPVTIMTVHLGLTAESRSTEMQNALALIANDEYVIMCGDFNTGTEADRAAVYGMAEAAGFTLSNGGYFGLYNTHQNNKAIDNILVKGNIKIKNYSVLADEYDNLCSDHYPTYADLLIY